MDPAVRRALETDKVIDITTIGRRSGERRRIEMWFHRVGGEVYLTGDPGPRDWYANLRADPRMTFHLKESVEADLAAVGRPVIDVRERRRIFAVISGREPERRPFDAYLAGSPLVHVVFHDRVAEMGAGRRAVD